MSKLSSEERALLWKMLNHLVGPASESDFEGTLDSLSSDLLWVLETRKLVQLAWTLTDAGRQALFDSLTEVKRETDHAGSGTVPCSSGAVS